MGRELPDVGPPYALVADLVDPKFEGHRRASGKPTDICEPAQPGATTSSVQYVLVEPPSRVVFTWGFAGNDAVPPGSSTVSVTLPPAADGTHLRLVHTGLPHPALTNHDEGWLGYLAQLAAVIGAIGPRS